MASKSLQTLSCFARSVNKGHVLGFTRNQFVNTLPIVNNVIHNLEIGLQKKFMSTENATKLATENLERVYNGQLTSQIRRVKMFSLSTSILGICCQPIIYAELVEMKNIPLMLMTCSVVGFFTFINPFLLHYITKKYITHLDYNSKKDSYVATIINFWCMNKKWEFTADEVIVPDVPGMFTTCVAKGKPMFLEARTFDDPSHYAKIMGYNKPMDFKLYQTSANKMPKT